MNSISISELLNFVPSQYQTCIAVVAAWDCLIGQINDTTPPPTSTYTKTRPCILKASGCHACLHSPTRIPCSSYWSRCYSTLIFIRPYIRRLQQTLTLSVTTGRFLCFLIASRIGSHMRSQHHCYHGEQSTLSVPSEAPKLRITSSRRDKPHFRRRVEYGDPQKENTKE